MLNVPNAQSERRTLSTYLLQNTWYCFRALQGQIADSHIPHSPFKENDSDTALFFELVCGIMASWVGHRNWKSVWLLAEWPWAKLLYLLPAQLPTSARRAPGHFLQQRKKTDEYDLCMLPTKRGLLNGNYFQSLLVPNMLCLFWGHMVVLRDDSWFYVQ